MSDEHRRLYGPLLEGMRKVVAQTAKRAAPVDKVVDVIEEAVTKERPRARYVAGTDARIQIALRRLLPTRAYDALIARMMGVRYAPPAPGPRPPAGRSGRFIQGISGWVMPPSGRWRTVSEHHWSPAPRAPSSPA